MSDENESVFIIGSKLYHVFCDDKKVQMPAKLNSFKYSFCVNIVNEWNNLPKEVAKAKTLNIYKNRLRCHFANVLGIFELFYCDF